MCVTGTNIVSFFYLYNASIIVTLVLYLHENQLGYTHYVINKTPYN